MITFEDWLSVDLKGKATGMASVVRRAVKALRSARVSAAVIGAIALGLRARERATKDIDFVADPRAWRRAIKAMRDAGFRDNPDWEPDEYLARFIDPKTRLGVDLLFGIGDPEQGARETARPTKLFGVTVKVARIDYLLWLYLLSDQPRHHDDALSVIRTGKVDLRKLREKLVIAGDREALSRLKDWAAEAKVPPEHGWRELQRKRRAKSNEEE